MSTTLGTSFLSNAQEWVFRNFVPAFMAMLRNKGVGHVTEEEIKQVLTFTNAAPVYTSAPAAAAPAAAAAPSGEAKQWKGQGFCPCIYKSGGKSGQVCNSKVYTAEGDGTRCYIHRNSKDIQTMNGAGAGAPAATPTPASFSAPPTFAMPPNFSMPTFAAPPTGAPGGAPMSFQPPMFQQAPVPSQAFQPPSFQPPMVFAPPPVQQPHSTETRQIHLENWHDGVHKYDAAHRFVLKPLDGGHYAAIGYSSDAKTMRQMEPQERTQALGLGYQTDAVPHVAGTPAVIPQTQPQVPAGLTVQQLMQSSGQAVL